MGKIISKLRDFTIKHDPLRGGDVILDKLGLPNMLGDKQGYMTQDIRDKEAMDYQKQQELLEKQMQARIERTTREMANADLSNSGKPTVLEGAAAVDAADEDERKRRSPNAKFSATLGLGG